MTPAELLEAAAEKVREPGMWMRGAMGSAGGPHCMAGWIWEVGGAYLDSDGISYNQNAILYGPLCKAWDTTSAYVMREHGFTAAGWNDHIATSADEVADMMLKVAKKLRNEGEQL